MYLFTKTLAAFILTMLPFVILLKVLKNHVYSARIQKLWPTYLGCTLLAVFCELVEPTKEWRVHHIPALSSESEQEQVVLSEEIDAMLQKLKNDRLVSSPSNIEQ